MNDSVLKIPYNSIGTYRVDASQYYPNTTYREIRENEWTIPSSALRFEQATINPWPFIGEQFLIIRPDSACKSIGTTLKVRATDKECITDPNDPNYYGLHRELHIERIAPTPTIQPPTSTVQWGIPTDITFTAQGTPTAESYEWTISGGFSRTGDTTTTAPTLTLTHNGCVDGFVRVRALYCGDKWSDTSTRATITITQGPESLQIFGSNVICTQEDYSVAVSQGTAVIWQATSNITLSYTTGSSTIAIPNTSNPTGIGSIFAVVDVPQCLYSTTLFREVHAGSVNSLGIGSTHHWNTVADGIYFDDELTYFGSQLTHGNIHGIFEAQWQNIPGGGVSSPHHAAHVELVHGSSINIFATYPGNNTTASIEARLQNHCGWSDWATITYLKPTSVTLPCGCVNHCTCPVTLPCGCMNLCTCPIALPCGCIDHCTCPPPLLPCGCLVSTGCVCPPPVLPCGCLVSTGCVCPPPVLPCGCIGSCGCPPPPPPTCKGGTPYCTGWCVWCTPDYDCPCDCQYPVVCIHDCPAEFTYSPNPVGNELSIDFTYIPAADGYSVKLMDKSGVTLRESKFNHRQRDGRTRSVRFNISNLPEGTYYLHISNGKSRRPQMQQIVIER